MTNYAMTPAQVTAMTQPHLMSYLFKSGFATAQNVDLNAGRGVGLELVKAVLKEKQAKLKIDFVFESYTEFSMSFPINASQNDHNANALTRSAA